MFCNGQLEVHFFLSFTHCSRSNRINQSSRIQYRFGKGNRSSDEWIYQSTFFDQESSPRMNSENISICCICICKLSKKNRNDRCLFILDNRLLSIGDRSNFSSNDCADLFYRQVRITKFAPVSLPSKVHYFLYKIYTWDHEWYRLFFL